jgi:peptide/nickel transport system substrate-binding protein
MDCAREQSVYLRAARNPFRDRRVREAISLAIDRDALTKGPLHGYADPAQQIPRPTEVGFDPALPPRRFDPERARLLLQQAGYRDGFETPLDYMPGKYLAVDAVVESLVLQLGQIGIRVRPQPRPPADMLQHVEARDTAFYLLGWMNETGSAHETYASLLHSVTANLGATNGGGYANPQFDLLVERVSGELDHAERVELLREATRIIDVDLPVVPLYRQHDLYAHVRALEFNPPPFGRLLLTRMRWRQS